MPKGKNKVPMAELRKHLETQGFHGVKTYIQSGNVICKSPQSKTAVESTIHDIILNQFGGDLTVIAVSPDQLKSIINNHPFEGKDTSKIYFTLLAEKPEKHRCDLFNSLNVSPDIIRLSDQLIYSCYATKLSDSKYHNNWFEKQLNVRATTRNWNTMTRLYALATAGE